MRANHSRQVETFNEGGDRDNLLQLILAMNRDEFVHRPTSPACVRGDLLAGWDEQPGREGGTWLALDTGTGRLGLLTNIFTGGVMDKDAKGRGFLVLDWLRGEQTAVEYLEALK